MRHGWGGKLLAEMHRFWSVSKHEKHISWPGWTAQNENISWSGWRQRISFTFDGISCGYQHQKNQKIHDHFDLNAVQSTTEAFKSHCMSFLLRKRFEVKAWGKQHWRSQSRFISPEQSSTSQNLEYAWCLMYTAMKRAKTKIHILRIAMLLALQKSFLHIKHSEFLLERFLKSAQKSVPPVMLFWQLRS
jgi:hypothetical protein